MKFRNILCLIIFFIAGIGYINGVQFDNSLLTFLVICLIAIANIQVEEDD